MSLKIMAAYDGNGSFRPWVVSALSRFGRGSFRPGSFRPESIRPWVVSANFGESFRPDFLFNPYILYYIFYARCVCYTRLVYHAASLARVLGSITG